MSANQYILEVHPKEALFLGKSDAGLGDTGSERERREGRRQASQRMGQGDGTSAEVFTKQEDLSSMPRIQVKKKKKIWQGEPFI